MGAVVMGPEGVGVGVADGEPEVVARPGVPEGEVVVDSVWTGRFEVVVARAEVAKAARLTSSFAGERLPQPLRLRL